MTSEDIAKQDAEFFKAWAKDKTLTRVNYNKKNPVKVAKKEPLFKNAASNFKKPPTQDHKAIYDALTTYCEKFPAVHKPNVILSGATGTGKTFITQIIANVLYERRFDVQYTTAFGMVKEFQNYIQSFGRDDMMLNKFLECDILIIDDLGSEPTIKNVTLEHIGNIINERLVNNRPFIITTNLSPQAIFEKYDQRIASRILSKESSAVFEVKGKDLRLS